MAKKGRHRKGGRYTPKGTRPHGVHPRPRDDELDRYGPEPEIMSDIRRALAEPHPVVLLEYASALLDAVDPRKRTRFAAKGDDADELTREELLRTFAGVDRRETTALLTAFGALVDDDLDRRRIERELERRSHDIPRWLARIDEASAYRAVEMTHVLRDGDDVMIGVRFAAGHELTAIVYVDHNLGTAVKDGFLIPDSIAEVVHVMRDKAADPDQTYTDITLADAKARVVDPLLHGSLMYPPLESETWPAVRPLVEWIVRQLPDGGRAYARPEWDEARRHDLQARFFASPFANGLGDDDHRELVDTLVWYGCDYGNGDPMLWSAVRVEILLADWIPRKIVADIDHLAKAPDVLRAFIEFCHAERGISPALTDETLRAVDTWEPEYQETIRTPRPQGPHAILAAMGALDPDGPWAMPGGYPASWESGDWVRPFLEEVAGGPDALAALDDEPLRDEPFDWSGIDDDVNERVGEVLALCDRCCDELLDVEYRTASRRVLARIARRGPEVFRRRGRAETAAAAICWAVRRANTEFAPAAEGPMQKDLLLHFGLTGSVSQRARTMLRAAGFPDDRAAFTLGSPDYLVAARRRWMVERRDALGSGTERPAG